MKKIAVIGASYFQLPLVRKAKDLGIEVHCFAWAEGAVCREYADYFYPISILDKDEILKICQNLKIDGIVTIGTDMAIPTISYVAEKMGLVANSVHSALLTTDKLEMRRALMKNHCPIPKFFEDFQSFLETKNVRFPLIVKPTDRSGSRGVSKVDSMKDVLPAVERARSESFSKSVIIEEFVSGHEVSVESISWKGAHSIIAITDKVTTGSPNFVEIAHHQPSNLSAEIQKSINDIVCSALDALEVKFGAGHTELLITKNGGVFVVEVGARMGGDFIGSHLVELSTGFDFVQAVIEISLGEFLTPKPSFARCSGVYFLSKETESILPFFKAQNSFEVEKVIHSEDLKYLGQSNDRSGYLIYQSDERINLIENQ